MKRILLISLFICCVFAEEKSADSLLSSNLEQHFEVINDSLTHTDLPDTDVRPFVLSLSGGGARGIAHIGVLKYFEEVGIMPDTIIGTSMGAIVGTLFACGYSSDEIYKILKPLSTGTLLYGNANSKSVRNKRKKSIVTLHFDKDFGISLPTSVASPQALDGVMGTSVISAQMSSGGDFDKLPIPLRIFTTNISTNAPQMHKEGDLLQIVKASAAVPGLLPPVKIDNDWHIDGGLRANIPVLDSRKHENYFMFAVDVSSAKNQKENLNSLVDVVLYAIEMGMNDAETKNAELADVVISPLSDEIKNTDYYRFDELVRTGYIAAQESFEKTPALQNYSHKTKLNKVTRPLSEFTVNAIELYGLEKAKEWYLRNILDMNLEKPMTEERISRITRIAEATDFFESFHITGYDDTLVAVVEEKERISIDFGIRFDNHNLAEVIASPKYSNIFGYGITARGDFQVGFLRKKILGEVNWTLPIKQSFNWYIEFNAYLSSQRLVSRQIDDSTHIDKEVINYSESDITKNGIMLVSGFEFVNSIAIFGGFRSEKYKSRQSQEDDVTFNFAEGRKSIKMFLTGVESDYRDDAYFPSFGGRHRFWLSGASNDWGSKDRFVTINGYSSFVIPINDMNIITPLVHITWADQELPSAMRYYIGGGRYEDFASYSNILYTIPFAGVENRGVFADNFAMFELSWRYQFTRSQPLYFLLYVDCGNLLNYDQNDDFSEISREFFRDIPIGLEAEIAYRTPVGPIRFSWSRLITGEFSENFNVNRKNVFRFSAGFDF